MPISREEVARIAALARLALDDDEMAGMTRDLGAILGYVETLRAAPLDGDAGEAEVSAPAATPFRDDEPRPALAPGEATEQAPGANHDLFRVPPVLGGS
jgi:aspartyl-tRNA(Asn)/glutamyl-tRNA(Gln) amidotransferase subunit C